MRAVNIVFPHQLFENSPLFDSQAPFYLIEEFLFFKQFSFHKQKIAFHRTTMKRYADFLEREMNFKVIYIDSQQEASDIRLLIPALKLQNIDHVNYIDPTDNWLNKRLTETCRDQGLTIKQYQSPLFINKIEDQLDFFREDKKRFYHASFYKEQRKKYKILLDEEDLPIGGRWSFDADNRKKYPAKKIPPTISFPERDEYYEEAEYYVEKNFSDNLGVLTKKPLYPTSFEETSLWLNEFFTKRFLEFGIYEDAIVAGNSFLNHSVLSPMLNIGLITPMTVIESCLTFSRKNKIPINSTEGFVRQIIGWREFVRGVYQSVGSKERTTNFWNFDKKIPASFYDGSTGIEPFDQTIKKVLQTGYCNHIERLMILGNFMLLCEFDPDEVYRWFMELFIDAYDWVMVPNVYGMSQYSDGGFMVSKPYISGSNYIIKMSDFKKGEWQSVWDGLFWRFIDKQRVFFLANPRFRMLVKMFDKMPDEKRLEHVRSGEVYLSKMKSY